MCAAAVAAGAQLCLQVQPPTRPLKGRCPFMLGWRTKLGPGPASPGPADPPPARLAHPRPHLCPWAAPFACSGPLGFSGRTAEAGRREETLHVLASSSGVCACCTCQRRPLLLGSSDGRPEGQRGAAAGTQVSGHPAQGRTHPQSPDSVPARDEAHLRCPLRPRASACFSPGGHCPSCKAGERAGPSWHLSRLVTPGQSCSSKARKTLCGPSPLRKQLSVQEETNRSTAGQDVKSGRDSPSRRAGPQPGSQSTVLWAPRQDPTPLPNPSSAAGSD